MACQRLQWVEKLSLAPSQWQLLSRVNPADDEFSRIGSQMPVISVAFGYLTFRFD
jgi:hypothetical protein